MTKLKYSKSDSDWDKLGHLVEKLENSRIGKPPFASLNLNSSKSVKSSDKLENTKNCDSDRDEESNHKGDKEKIIEHPLQNVWTIWFFMFDNLCLTIQEVDQ